MKVFRKNGYYSPPCIEPQPRSRLLDTVRRRVEMRAARESRFAAKFLHISVLPSSISPARPTPLCGVGRAGMSAFCKYCFETGSGGFAAACLMGEGRCVVKL